MVPVKALDQLWLVDATHKLDGVAECREAGEVVVLAAGIHGHRHTHHRHLASAHPHHNVSDCSPEEVLSSLDASAFAVQALSAGCFCAPLAQACATILLGMLMPVMLKNWRQGLQRQA